MTTEKQTREWLDSKIGMVSCLLKFDSDGQYCIDIDFLAHIITHYTNMKECEMKTKIAKIDGKIEGTLGYVLDNYNLGERPNEIINDVINEINSKYTPIDVLKKQLDENEKS